MKQLSTPVQELTREHKEVLAKIASIEKILQNAKNQYQVSGQETPALLDLLRSVSTILEPHIRKEEEAFFPAIEKHIEKEGQPIEALLAEHKNILKLNDEMKKRAEETPASTRFPELTVLGSRLVFLVRNHIYKENTVLFQIAEEELNDAEKQSVRKKFAHFSSSLPKT